MNEFRKAPELCFILKAIATAKSNDVKPGKLSKNSSLFGRKKVGRVWKIHSQHFGDLWQMSLFEPIISCMCGINSKVLHFGIAKSIRSRGGHVIHLSTKQVTSAVWSNSLKTLPKLNMKAFGKAWPDYVIRDFVTQYCNLLCHDRPRLTC